MRQFALFTFAGALAIAGCGGAPMAVPPTTPAEPIGDGEPEAATEDDPDAKEGSGEKTVATEGKMTDVPGDEAADMVPECEDKDACNNMGVFAAMSGKGNVAAALLQRACDLGNGTGCSNLANLYSAGEVLTKDQEKAASLDIRGCELGEPKACVNAALAHFDGVGVKQDHKMALDFFAKGCDLDHAESCKNTGVLHWEGKGVPQDHAKAVTYFEKACSAGEASGCFNLGVANYKGLGATKDDSKAREYFNTACEKGDKGGCDLRDELDAKASAPVPGANLTVGSLSANGMTVNDLQCAISGGGFMVSLQLVGAIAGQKKALDRCAPGGDAARVTWTMGGGKTSGVKVEEGKNGKVNKCVTRAAKKIKSAMNGTCSAVFLFGKEKGSKAAYDKRFGGE